MQTVHSVPALRAKVQSWRQAGELIAFVPTMGNLHEGHLTLVREALKRADRVVVSIFVNPLQFGPNEDLDSYPRTEQRDAAQLMEAGVDLLFLPAVEEMYPQGQENLTRVCVPELSRELCGASRPGHFEGVATVVTKLFNMVQPDLAFFGEKDYQQLTIIRRMVTDLNLPVQVVGVPTVREADGLALSSRNGYLSEAERAKAAGLYKVLSEVKAAVLGGTDPRRAEAVALERLQQAGFEPDYVSIRHADDLSVAEETPGNRIVLAAVRLGSTRLIDNLRIDD